VNATGNPTDAAGRVESRWPPAVAVLLFAGLNAGLRLWLPNESVIGVPWLAPTIEILLFGVLVAGDPVGLDRRSRWLRRTEITLVLLLLAAALWATVILGDHLVDGSKHTGSAGYLLASGALVLLGMNVTFALVYWEFDSGGPSARAGRSVQYLDLAFPQQLNPELSAPGWLPRFVDYLYLGFTNNTAFSPTDVMPLVPWAKAAMALQATVSLVVIGLVLARAVNVLS
jgi:hypothetical protein